ncbi:MAG TPA: hypothetical protein VNW04_06400 [Puia sp.]|jgi:hypothetical protein|nr:hypothetical protein [Puia sp.]
MRKHNGYDLVRPMFISGKLTLFSDIFEFDLVPKSVAATDLGKEKTRFKQLIQNPAEFIYQEIRLFSAKCNLQPFEIGVLIENEHPSSPGNDEGEKAEKYAAIKPMVAEGSIHLLEDIFKYIPKYPVAEKIGRKGATLDRYLKNVAGFPIGDIRAIGTLFDLQLPAMLKLVEAQYREQQSSKTRKSK